MHIIPAKRGADRYVPILPALADELRIICGYPTVVSLSFSICCACFL
jgi:hypothetical protein